MCNAMHLHILSYMLLLSTPAATPPIYTLSLHDALPISLAIRRNAFPAPDYSALRADRLRRSSLGILDPQPIRDRKSTRLNSSHEWISYAVFCLQKIRLVGWCSAQRRRAGAAPQSLRLSY